jgi:hypothetical protein
VRVVLAGIGMPSTPAIRELIDSGLRPLPSPREDLLLWENPNALPRAYVTYRLEPAPPPEELLARLSAADFDPMVTSYVEGPVPTSSRSSGHPAKIVRDDPEVVEVEGRRARLPSFSPTVLPGLARDRRRSECADRGNEPAFPRVAAPAGTRPFEYRPMSVRSVRGRWSACVVGWAPRGGAASGLC